VISIEIFEKFKTDEIVTSLSDPENLAYVSMHNFYKMHCMETFYADPTERTQNNNS